MIDHARIDFAAGESHFLEHLAPVWHALDDEHRGRFYVPDSLESRAELAGVVPWPLGELEPSPRLTVVASVGDWRSVGYGRTRPVALAQHGAGQSYGGDPRSARHASYPGAAGMERIRLFLVPNDQAAARWRRRYRSIPVAVVGSPRVDELTRVCARTNARPCAAISFHWRCKVGGGLEAGTALDHYASSLARARIELADAGVELLGHGHPRALDELAPLYAAAEIELVEDFAAVVDRASVYAVDNSSTLFEFAALDRPVVVLNGPGMRRNVRHGLRFWSEADVGLNVDEPAELASTILGAFLDPADVAEKRRAAVSRVYVRQGDAASAATEALLAVSACPACGAPDHRCGPTSSSRPLDVVEEVHMSKGPKRYYDLPNGRGRIKATEQHARTLGLIPGGEPTGILSSSSFRAPHDELEDLEARLERLGASPAEIADLVDEVEASGPEAVLERFAALSDRQITEAIVKSRNEDEPVDDTAPPRAEDKKVAAPSRPSTTSAGRRRPKAK